LKVCAFKLYTRAFRNSFNRLNLYLRFMLMYFEVWLKNVVDEAIMSSVSRLAILNFSCHTVWANRGQTYRFLKYYLRHTVRTNFQTFSMTHLNHENPTHSCQERMGSILLISVKLGYVTLGCVRTLTCAVTTGSHFTTSRYSFFRIIECRKWNKKLLFSKIFV
jgi:hypothetical protein